MFRRFFQRNGQEHASQPQKSESSEAYEPPEHVKQAKNLLQQQTEQKSDDSIHRMVLRAGGQQPPDDPDEQVYDMDQGEHGQLARSALAAKDFKRSIYHLGLALASDPLCEEWLMLLDQWITARGPDALDFVPLDDPEYFATLEACQFFIKQSNTPTHRVEAIPLVGKNYHAKVAIHAYILASQGRVKEAVALLLQLARVRPTIPYQVWLPRWQEQPGFADALQPEQVAALAMQLLQKYPGSYVFSERGHAEINRCLPLLHKTYTMLVNEQMSERFVTFAFVYAMALRKIGSFEEAVHIARTLPTTSYQAQVALAMAEETVGNLDACVAAYQQALTVRPDDVALRNDLGQIFFIQGKRSEALAFYKESVQLDPKDPYQEAFSHIAYLEYLQTPSSEATLVKLKTLAQTQRTAHHLLSLLQTPYLGKLPFVGEALINLMRDFKAKSARGDIKLKAGSTINIGLSSLEAPSARLASRLMLETRGISYELAVGDVFSPDPRQPLRPVEYQLWHYEGMDPIPVVSPPDPAIAERIAMLARIPYALDHWYASAHVLGQDLGPDALMSLLGVMIHPPTVPETWDEWDWVIAIQVASALTIASLDTGWEGSRRKAALTSLIYGPLDWSGAAALIAMAVLARLDARIRIEFDRLCCDLWHFGPGSAEWPLEQAMVSGLIFVDAYSDEARNYVNKYFERLREEQK